MRSQEEIMRGIRAAQEMLDQHGDAGAVSLLTGIPVERIRELGV